MLQLQIIQGYLVGFQHSYVSCRVFSDRKSSHALIIGGIDNIIGEIDEELRKATLRGCIIPKNGREGGIS